MQKNVGTLSRTLRTVPRFALISLLTTGTVGWCGCIGSVALTTWRSSRCPADSLLGIKTCKAGCDRRLLFAATCP